MLPVYCQIGLRSMHPLISNVLAMPRSDLQYQSHLQRKAHQAPHGKDLAHPRDYGDDSDCDRWGCHEVVLLQMWLASQSGFLWSPLRLMQMFCGSCKHKQTSTNINRYQPSTIEHITYLTSTPIAKGTHFCWWCFLQQFSLVLVRLITLDSQLTASGDLAKS